MLNSMQLSVTVHLTDCWKFVNGEKELRWASHIRQLCCSYNSLVLLFWNHLVRVACFVEVSVLECSNLLFSESIDSELVNVSILRFRSF